MLALPGVDKVEQVPVNLGAFRQRTEIVQADRSCSRSRLSSQAIGLAASHREANWRHAGWRGRLARQAPTLAALMADQREQQDALELVALLRNSVHG